MNRINTKPIVRSQRGAATVESALTLLVFLVLVFGIIEFAMLIFRASSLVEATRAGARYLIVNDPVSLSALDCDNPQPAAPCTDGVSCDTAIEIMQRYYEPLEPEQVFVQYSCSSTGYNESYFHIYEVEVSVRNAEYQFMIPGILGLGATVTLPDFATSKISEDLETVPPEE